MARKGKSAQPTVAVEITAERVIAARAARDRGALDAYSVRALPEGAVTPNLQNANIAGRTEVAQAISAALAGLGARPRDVTVVVPDAAARVMIMDFDTFPEREQEALPLIRFRLKKLLPFDAERATVSYQAYRNGAVRVVAAVAASGVLEEYEDVVRSCGCNPGVVLPSVVAALGLVDASQPTLLIKSDAGTASVAIADQDELRLVRTLAGDSFASPEQVADEVHPLLVFFQDTFGSRIERLLLAGNLHVETVRPMLEAQTGARVQELVSGSLLGGSGGAQVLPGALAGVAGALLQL